MTFESFGDVIDRAGNFLDYHLFKVADTPITVATLLTFFIILAVTALVSALTRRAIVRIFRSRGMTDEGTTGVMTRLVHYAILAVGVAIGVQTIGINLAALFTAGAVVAIGVGLAMQNLAQNFISGIQLLLERTIKPGDVLHVEGRMVKVQDMGIRATIVRTLDEEEMIVPNSILVQSTVTNYTLRDSLYRLRATVGVVYSTDVLRALEVLNDAMLNLSFATPRKKPVVLLTEFADSAIVFELSVWTETPWQVRRQKSEVNVAIWTALKNEGMTIAFPQLDVHLDPPVTEAISSMSRVA